MKKTELSIKLKKLRTDAGLTRKQLGEILNLQEMYKSKPDRIIETYERGVSIPKEQIIQRYCQYFMIHPKYIKTLIPDKKKTKRNLTKESRWKLGSGNRGKKQKPKANEKRSKTLTGVPKTKEHRKNIARAKTGTPLPQTIKDKISQTKREKFLSTQETHSTYYRCLEKNKYGIPKKIERSYYNEKGTFLGSDIIFNNSV